MYPPPADPWGPEDEPTVRDSPYLLGRAPVREPTAEFPAVTKPSTVPVAGPVPVGRRTVSGVPQVSWQRPGKASRRTLSDGWGLTAFGGLVLFCGWGVWAAADGQAVIAPFIDLCVVLAVGAVVFVALRMAGRLIIEGIRHRPRPHARWSHFFTGLYLAAVGVLYFVNTSWLIEVNDWLRDQWSRL